MSGYVSASFRESDWLGGHWTGCRVGIQIEYRLSAAMMRSPSPAT